MPLTRPKLWQQLFDFQFDELGASFPSSDRLARDSGWSHEFAILVISEYRRFIYLAMVSDHPVTPSDEVDQAWHLHLAYTRSYWDDMCGKVLGRPLHHGPTKGGHSEKKKFHDWYSKTKRSYLDEFDVEPPLAVWPSSSVRFGLAPFFVRTNKKTHWLIDKENSRKKSRVAILLSFILVVFTSCSFQLSDIPAWVYWAAGTFWCLVVIYGLGAMRNPWTRKGRGNPEDSDDDDQGPGTSILYGGVAGIGGADSTWAGCGADVGSGDQVALAAAVAAKRNVFPFFQTAKS